MTFLGKTVMYVDKLIYIVDEVEGVGLCWNVPEYRLIDLSQWSVLEPQDPDNGCNGSYSHRVTL